MTNTDEFVMQSLYFAETCRKTLESSQDLEYFVTPFIEAADKYIGSMETPKAQDVPLAVKRSVVLAAHDMAVARTRLAQLTQCGLGSDKYWGFNIGSMFVGVEPDGYMHT